MVLCPCLHPRSVPSSPVFLLCAAGLAREPSTTARPTATAPGSVCPGKPQQGCTPVFSQAEYAASIPQVNAQHRLKKLFVQGAFLWSYHPVRYFCISWGDSSLSMSYCLHVKCRTCWLGLGIATCVSREALPLQMRKEVNWLGCDHIHKLLKAGALQAASWGTSSGQAIPFPPQWWEISVNGAVSADFSRSIRCLIDSATAAASSQGCWMTPHFYLSPSRHCMQMIKFQTVTSPLWSHIANCIQKATKTF